MNRASATISEARNLAVPPRVEEERLGRLAASLLMQTKRAASKYPEVSGVLLGGSYAKGTWLPGRADLDIFVKFDPSTEEAEFEKAGLAIGRLATRGHPAGKKFAQHPYTEATVEGAKVNIVPCFAVKKGEWKSAADRSPFHVTLVRKLSEESKTQVRLLKLFMHAVGVYGAEIERQGFSGYVAEVLILRHKSLEDVLAWFAGWSETRDGRPFSLPDPVDGGRDLGIAVSGESVGRMVLAAREFLRRPDRAFFHGMRGRERPSMRNEVLAVLFSHRAMSEDILWGELRRTTRHMVKHIEVQGFRIARSMAASNNRDRSAILLIPETRELPPLEQRLGPTVDRGADVGAFLSSNSRGSRLVWVDDQARVRLLKPRLHTQLRELLVAMAKGKEGEIGASREVERGMRRSASVLSGSQLSRAAASAGWLNAGIREITSDAIGAR